MQRNELTTEQILARCNALWDRDGLNTLVGDETVHTPFRAIKRIFGDLEPSTSDTRVGFRVADFLEVGHDGAFVGGIDDVVGARGEGVAPCEGGLGAGLHGDDGVGLGWCVVGRAVADY